MNIPNKMKDIRRLWDQNYHTEWMLGRQDLSTANTPQDKYIKQVYQIRNDQINQKEQVAHIEKV